MQFIKHDAHNRLSTITCLNHAHETPSILTKDASTKILITKAVHSILQRPLLSSPSTPLVGRYKGQEVRDQFDSTFAHLYHDLDMGFTPINFMLMGTVIARTEEEIELRKDGRHIQGYHSAEKGLREQRGVPSKRKHDRKSYGLPV